MKGVGLTRFVILVDMVLGLSALKELLTLFILMVMVWAIWNSLNLVQGVRLGFQKLRWKGSDSLRNSGMERHAM